MKKYLILASVLFVCGCATSNKNGDIVTLLSYEKNTDIFVNNELVGITHTQTKLPYKKANKTVLEGRKKGCKTTTLQANYDFDYMMILNPFNLLYVPEKYFSWDWWKPSEDKTLYNVTPVCD